MSDFKEIFKPQTTFSIKEDINKRFTQDQAQDIYMQQLEKHANEEVFCLIDGPPYANGNIHTGHLVNKIQKDIINQHQFMLGKKVIFNPGSDCHGLPIEKKVEQILKEEAKDPHFDIKKIPSLTIRSRCKDFANHWVEVQAEEFSSLGVFANWNNNFTTMDASLNILKSFFIAVKKGYVYKDLKPILWSIAEQTSMATAEVEYKDHESTSIDIGFKVHKSSVLPADSEIVIWTTTPWTIPANRAICYGADIDYVLIKTSNKQLSVAKDLLETFLTKAEITECEIIKEFKGRELEGTVCHHPFYSDGYDFDVPLLPGDHVTLDGGTGYVHTAPGHGEEDFQIGKKYDLEITDYVTENGFFKDAPMFAGMHMKKVQEAVLNKLEELGCMYARKQFKHSYPYSWRSHTPLIYRVTPQCYISVKNIRSDVLQMADNIDWHPKESINRFKSMMENRPDWCITRQRSWGVPVALFLENNQLCLDQAIIDKTFEYISKHGTDAWWSDSTEQILGSEYSHLEKILDVLDVWFDAGAMHYCLQNSENKYHAGTPYPLDLYLEGSDQHRGFFQACLCIDSFINSDNEDKRKKSISPVKSILTHGFILDEKGRKMSKSLGNTVAPEAVLQKYSLDTVRLWVALTDCTDDIKYSNKQLDRIKIISKRLRNTVRYTIACLHDLDSSEILPLSEWNTQELCLYSKLLDLNQKFLTSNYNYKSFYEELYQFCDEDLSSLYFDSIKDVLYCDGSDSKDRQSIRSFLHILRSTLVKWITPAMKITAEEAWSAFEKGSIYLEKAPELEKIDKADIYSQIWQLIKENRSIINMHIEKEREKKTMTVNNQASAQLFLTQDAIEKISNLISIENFTEILKANTLVAELEINEGNETSCSISVFEGIKCARCRRLYKTLASDELCSRCFDVSNK